MLILDGNEVAKNRREALKAEIANWRASGTRAPGLAAIIVGDDPASHVYVRNKIKACALVGIESFHHRLPATTTQTQLKDLLWALNQDECIDGILLQLPLPKHLSADEALTHLSPKKDPDGLTIENIGLLASGRPRVEACTPKGVMSILEHYKISCAGKHAVVIGRSQIVGKPMAQLLVAADATVTICHSRTPQPELFSREADLVVVAAGRPRHWGRDAFKRDSVVIDVGIHRDSNAKLCGDVRFEELSGWVAAATPVPGGVGPMTITSLLENTFILAKAARD